ncbi:MAG: undecaprenyl-diphosphate phosphatase [Candidatus Bathyarchaeia archaeon]
MFEIILLGIIQGLTEWFPISSTGHLKLAKTILGINLPSPFDIILHVGTLIATIIFFREDVKKILRALLRLDFSKSEGGIIIKRILIGTAFTVPVSLILMSLERLFYGERITGFLFLLSGLITYLSRIRKVGGKQIDLKGAALIGAMQGLSILPGLSRSGLTISVALMLGVKREEAFKFSFLISIPSIIGGLVVTSIMQCNNILQETGIEIRDIFIGTLISALLGYFSLKILRRTLKYFHNFALYSLLLGLLLILMPFYARF